MQMASILWRRLDRPGHDACSLVESDAGWRLDGAAVFLHDDGPARLAYQVVCDREWRTKHGRVAGWLGEHAVEFDIALTNTGVWTLNGAAVSGLEHCVDLDLGFTPATNLLPIRRLALPVGKAADAPAAWLDVSAGTLGILAQRYERRSGTMYGYEAPGVEYEAFLEVASTGFVRRYPGLWEAEA